MVRRRVPGSGKSTLGYPLADRINELLGAHVKPAAVDEAEAIAVPGWEAEGVDEVLKESREEVALCVGQDGWHFTKRELEAFSVRAVSLVEERELTQILGQDPAEAKRRRVRCSLEVEVESSS